MEENYKDMMLESRSGYAMPFMGEGEDVTVVKNFGKQENGPFCNGMEFQTNKYKLLALADGVVNGISSNEKDGFNLTIRYGHYDVKYSNLTTICVEFGSQVIARQHVAVSKDLLRIEVRFKGKLMNPADFLEMLRQNVGASGIDPDGVYRPIETEREIPTEYDEEMPEIENLMSKHLMDYFKAVASGSYSVPDFTEQSLRNAFSLASLRNIFYECLPSISNPLGLGSRAVPLATKIQNLIIGDFLQYLGVQQQITIPSVEARKKKARRQRVITNPLTPPTD